MSYKHNLSTKRYSTKSTDSKDSSIQLIYNLANNRNVHTIKVQSFKKSSPHSAKKEQTGGSQDYGLLISHSSINNCLLGYSTTRRKSFVYLNYYLNNRHLKYNVL